MCRKHPSLWVIKSLQTALCENLKCVKPINEWENRKEEAESIIVLEY